MYDIFLTVVTTVSDFMWGPWTMVFIAFVSVFLTVRARFSYILRNTFGTMFSRRGDADPERMTPFQATTTSLATSDTKE